MKKTPWKKILSSALTCFVIALAVFLVFRGNYQEILENLSKAPLWGTAVLFALAAAYQAAEAGICMALVRARLPGFSYRDAVGVTFLGKRSYLRGGVDPHAELPAASMRLDDRAWDRDDDDGVCVP